MLPAEDDFILDRFLVSLTENQSDECIRDEELLGQIFEGDEWSQALLVRFFRTMLFARTVKPDITVGCVADAAFHIGLALLSNKDRLKRVLAIGPEAEAERLLKDAETQSQKRKPVRGV